MTEEFASDRMNIVKVYTFWGVFLGRCLRWVRATGVKKYRPDIFFVAIAVSCVPLMIVKSPVMKYGLTASPELQWDKKTRLDVVVKSGLGDYTSLSAKNVFSPDGMYPQDKKPEKVVRPPKIYTLLGVLLEDGKRAVLLDDSHAVHVVKDGEAIESAATEDKENIHVLSITGPTSVTLKSESGDRELKIFSVKR
ncbi:MAG: hypothetical protein HQK89_07180 [Nitrospirae bacterium]|nr:hypothetical protein [Nitrospirota bacterium]